MIELIPISGNYDISQHTEEPIKSALEATFEYYEKIGITVPWISYIAKAQSDFVGICSFKGKPIENKVEIAYYTFQQHEGNGYATAMCKNLIDIAHKERKDIIISARTLPEKNASTSVLVKNGFSFARTVVDYEDGEVYEWVL